MNTVRRITEIVVFFQIQKNSNLFNGFQTLLYSISKIIFQCEEGNLDNIDVDSLLDLYLLADEIETEALDVPDYFLSSKASNIARRINSVGLAHPDVKTSLSNLASGGQINIIKK